jgi:hypothetical protein
MKTQLVPLGFDTLDDLDDGRIAAILRQHITRVSADCYDRPGDPTLRKILLEFQFKPVIENDGSCEEVGCHIECRSKLPTHRSKRISMRVTKNGLLFNREFPEELDAQSLPFDDEESSE